MLFRSLGKQLLKNGKIVTESAEASNYELQGNAGVVNEEDVESGWIYILRSKSTNPDIAGREDLYKIGYSTVPVKDRVKNAAKQPTYLMAEVQIVTTFKCYNLNAQKFEQLIQRFFAKACLNVDVFDDKSRRYTPREWFVVPLGIIEKAVNLIIEGHIHEYEYDIDRQALLKKPK